jgi:hypothetical protein
MHSGSAFPWLMHIVPAAAIWPTQAKELGHNLAQGDFMSPEERTAKSQVGPNYPNPSSRPLSVGQVLQVLRVVRHSVGE